MTDDKKVVPLNAPQHDRVLNLANAVCKAVASMETVNKPEEHLAALYLAEEAIKHIVIRKYGVLAVEAAMVRGGEIADQYRLNLSPKKTIYDKEEQPPNAEVVKLRED